MMLNFTKRGIDSFLLDNGARVSEVCGLKIRDVDLKERTALIHGKTRMSGGENKQRLVPVDNWRI